jgi:organic radical activating enzyme
MIEIFSSVQGEGLLIGLRQVFLRFQACNLDCSYCDTGRNFSEFCAIEGVPGRRDFVQFKNPVSIDHVVSTIDKWQKGWPGIHNSISLTGGEPLLNNDILLAWLPELKKRLPIYLETNGTLHLTLASLIRHIDHICMDIKLPSTSGHPELWEPHREFLKIAVQKDVSVKIVIGDTTEDWEIIRSSELISSISSTIPLVLQPLTLEDGKIGISPVRLLELHELATAYLRQVRIIPQTHKFLGLL